VSASVSIANVGCGHAVPTGEPMRALVMVVEAHANDCGELKPIGGMTLSDVGGARAQGVVGQELFSTGDTVTWTVGDGVAQIGQMLRVTRATGEYDDYTGINYFANENLSPEEKGLPIMAPVGEAVVTAIDGADLTLDEPIAMEPGDVVYLGDAMPQDIEDGDDARYLAGKAGYAFSKVLVDSAGGRHVPHYKAVDMVSDNRIPPGGRALTTHHFSLPDTCGTPTVTARVFYRPHPLSLAVTRGWDSKDYLISTAQASAP